MKNISRDVEISNDEVWGIIHLPGVKLYSQVALCLEVNPPQFYYPHKEKGKEYKTQCAKHLENHFMRRKYYFIVIPKD
jgi:hypothetical protein